MLKSWSIENFKPIVNSGELQFAPVTVLAGRNSSGKSSLLQSILMIAQTLSNQIPDRALLPNERIVQLGTFEDILSILSNTRTFRVGFELEIDDDTNSPVIPPAKHVGETIKVATTFQSANQDVDSSSALEASKVLVENGSIEATQHEDVSADSGNATNYAHLSYQRMPDQILNPLVKNILRERRLGGELPDYIGTLELSDKKFSKTYLLNLSHFLPVRFFEEYQGEGKNFFFRLITEADGLPDAEILLIANAAEQVTAFFSRQIRYLGPLRGDPSTTQRFFAPTSELDDVGPKGEYAAVTYHYNQLAQINWYNPDHQQVEQGTLQAALDAWIRYFGMAEQVSTEMFGAASGVTWKVTLIKGQKPHSLPEIGGGVNHILPIIVMGLLAPTNTLLIIEEPEVTLHPRVQARLGDFFVGLAKCKKQCLIETHSENLVSQLRYHIVQAGGMDKSDCMIYFVDQDERGAAVFQPVEISPQGNILNWPDGFFDETMLQEDRITAASLRKRANKVKHG